MFALKPEDASEQVQVYAYPASITNSKARLEIRARLTIAYSSDMYHRILHLQTSSAGLSMVRRSGIWRAIRIQYPLDCPEKDALSRESNLCRIIPLEKCHAQQKDGSKDRLQ